MTEEQLATYQARNSRQRGIPVLDALIAPEHDSDAVGSGQEIALHMEIIKECCRRTWPYIYHNPTKKTAATLGTPDFIIYADAGRVLNVECKTKTGKLSKDQVNLKREIEAKRHEYHVVRSLTAFLRLADRRGKQ